MDHTESTDFLDELIAEGAAEDPLFPATVDAAVRRRVFLRSLANLRESRGMPQAVVAERMRTQQPAVARLERGEGDPKLSTLERYATALGLEIEIRLTEPVVPRRLLAPPGTDASSRKEIETVDEQVEGGACSRQYASAAMPAAE